MAVCLLTLLTTTFPTPRNTLGVKKSGSAEYGWILSSMTRFWHSISSEGIPNNTYWLASSTLVQFLNSILSFCTDMVKEQQSAANFAITSRFMSLLTEVIAPLLNDMALPMAASVETALCLILIEITASGEKSVVVRHTFAEHLLPRVLSAKAKTDRFDRFDQDLQV